MKVSVVIPTRNRSAWLALTLRSVLRQRHDDLEVIVVDDGSIDDTAEILSRVTDRRVRVVRHESPHGVAASRNHGAAVAEGEWLAFLDDDDVWAPDKLSSQIEAVLATNCAWVYTGSVTIDERGGILGGQPPPLPDHVMRLVRRYNVIPGGGSNVLLRRNEFEVAGPFDPRLKNTEDWEMWIRLSERGIPACVALPLVGYRVHTMNASLDVRAILEGVLMIERQHRTRVDRGVLHRWIAEVCLRNGDRGQAVKHMAVAAARGEITGVANDAATILRRRFGRSPRQGVDGSSRHARWLDQARPWLEELHALDGSDEGDRTRSRRKGPF